MAWKTYMKILEYCSGINADNVEEYAATGIDSINTTWVYFRKPVNIGVRIETIICHKRS